MLNTYSVHHHKMKRADLLYCFTVLVIFANNAFSIKLENPTGVCTPVENQMCKIKENILTYVSDVSSLAECHDICHDEKDCAFLTYFGSNSSPFSDTCVIFSSCDTLEECEDCITEDGSCLPLTECFITTEDGSMTPRLVITDTSRSVTITPVALGTCDLTVVAVGGGGEGGILYGGGGSGYVEWSTLNITETQQLTVTVGDGKAESVVLADGEIIVRARPGESSSHDYEGGDGYSGGGSYGGDGGTNGGNGHDGGYPGGKGSNVMVADIPVKRFILTPGLGGEHHGFGGGGGGVLVDGEGPEQGSKYNGEGYGGGGSANNSPLPGVVIVSFN